MEIERRFGDGERSKGEKGEVKKIKMWYVWYIYVPVPHNEYIHYVLQVYTSKIFNAKTLLLKSFSSVFVLKMLTLLAKEIGGCI